MNNDFDDKNKENNVENENEQSSSDNLNDKKTKEEEFEKLAKEVNNLIEEVSDEYGIDPNKVKVMPISMPKMKPKMIITTSIFVFILDFIVIVGLSGFIGWAEWEKTLSLVFFALYFAGLDLVLKLISLPLFPKNPKNIVLILALKVLPFIITMIVCGVLPIFIKIVSYLMFIIICAISYSIRKFLIAYYLEKQMKKALDILSRQ